MSIINPETFRKVLGYYPTGVCVITSIEDGRDPIGMSIGSFTSVSLDPPLVAFLPDRRSATWRRIYGSKRFCVNVLGDHQETLCRRFATSAADKFDGVAYRASGLGLPILNGVVAWIDCLIHSVHDAGDHSIVVGRVVGLEAGDTAQPLLFHKGGYGQVVPLAVAA